MFNVIPDNFFVPLASPNKIVYWECLCKLFSVMDHQLSFGVEREVLTDELEFYFDQANAADIVADDDGLAGSDSRSKANAMLRRLESYHWIEIETDKSYVQRVNFTEYAVSVMKTLLEIENGKQIEYQGYIYTIYSLVRTRSDQPGLALMQIVENTDLLITGLKNLNSNIKHYIDELTKHSTVSQIMDALFNDYITNIVDKAYHRLLTSDNVSKFRPEIIEKLENHSRSEKYVSAAADELAGMKEITPEAARELVYQYLHQVVEAFRDMDDILEEINQKNTQYQRAAINRAKFLLTGSEDIRGQLKEILLEINHEMNERQMVLDGIYEIAFLEELVRIYHCSVIDDNSLYAPTEGKKEFAPQKMTLDMPDLAFRQEKMKRMMEKLQRTLSVEKINKYVDRCLGDRMCMVASELPLENEEDFVKIIYIRLYGQRKKVPYQVIVKEETAVGGYRFTDFEIRRKQ